MIAMRERMGAVDIQLANVRPSEAGESGSAKYYVFDIVTSTEKLVPRSECTLVNANKGEYLVMIIAVDAREVTLKCERTMAIGDGNCSLVIYPWFLYEKLNEALGSLIGETGEFFTDNALALFGKRAPTIAPRELLLDHASLNRSQRAAVQLCSDSSLAFVWGPPGTGKTVTLGHIVAELLARGSRILITSMTNAAVDQALAKLVEIPAAAGYFERGEIIRIGQSAAETHGAGLREVVERVNVELRELADRLRTRATELPTEIDRCAAAGGKLRQALEPMQFDMFRETAGDGPSERELAGIFGEGAAARIVRLPLEEQREIVQLRKVRLERALELCREKLATTLRELRNQESTAVERGRVIMATMTNMYVSTLLREERFDVVIVEEAGMAILPSLFYCASLARGKVIMVGDPKQLPPIVQSGDEFVQRAMGRNIFDVTVPEPHSSPLVAMLNVQYRMHPSIGGLVSRMFYDGRLLNGESTGGRSTIAARKPYPGESLVVVDTGGRTSCATKEGSYSRFNRGSAELCVELAVEAIRDGMESVAIITPYAEQSRLIRQLLSGFRLESQMVECRTVHSFQGSERDLVIVDTVDTAPMSPGVLLAGSGARSSSRNLMNVSISRARGKLVMVSDVLYFRNNAPRSAVDEVLRHAMADGMTVGT
jgi:hypothetical protein